MDSAHGWLPLSMIWSINIPPLTDRYCSGSYECKSLNDGCACLPVLALYTRGHKYKIDGKGFQIFEAGEDWNNFFSI